MGRDYKKHRKIFLFLYVSIVLYLTIFSRSPGTERITRGLFWEVKMGYWKDIVLNILLFFPIGFLGRKKGVLFGFLLSLVIEITQYVCLLGFCEVDDVLNNTIGCFIGYLIGNGGD